MQDEMADFSLSDLAASAGTRTGEFAKDGANAAANFVCGLYKDFPGAVIPNPASAFLKGMWDSLCQGRPPGLPPPPAPPFTGGQCVGVKYSIGFKYDYYQANGTTIAYSPVIDFHNQLGAIQDARITGSAGAWRFQTLVNGTWGTILTSSDSRRHDNGRITYATRADGLADNCGNVPGKYPIVVIPTERRSTNTSFTYNDGASLTIPLVYAPVSLELPVTVNVGGVDLNFDLGGVTFNTGAKKIEGDTITNKFNEVNTAIQNVDKRITLIQEGDRNSSTSISITIGDPETGDKEKSGIDRLESVLVTLTTIPKDAKMQFGNGAPNVIYAGWFEFRRGTEIYPREPIHFEKSLFRAPLGATGFAYTLNYGYAGVSKVYRYRPQADQPKPI